MKSLLLTTLLSLFALVNYAQPAKLPKLKPLKEKELQMTLTPLAKKDEWGYANEEGKFIIKHIFSEARPYVDGIAIVKYMGFYGILNSEGTFLVTPQYQEMSDFTNGYAIVRKDGLFGTIDRSGNILTPCEYELFERREGFNITFTYKNQLWGALDNNGRITVAPCYYDVQKMQNGFAFVVKDDKMGTVDANLSTMIPAEYTYLKTDSDGNLIATKNGRWGMLTPQNRVLIPVDYDNVERSPSGKYIQLYKGVKRGYYSSDYRLVLEPSLTSLPSLTSAYTFLLDGQTVHLLSESNRKTWRVSTAIDVTNIESLTPPEDNILTPVSLDASTLMFMKNGRPYYITEGKNILWAANGSIRNFAAAPVNYELNFADSKRTFYFKGLNYENQIAFLEREFNLSLPESSNDYRLNIDRLKTAIYKEIISGYEGHESYPVQSINDVYSFISSHPSEEGIRSLHVIPHLPARTSNEEDGGSDSNLWVNQVGDTDAPDLYLTFGNSVYFHGAAGAYAEESFRVFNKETGQLLHLRDRFSQAQIDDINRKIEANEIYDTDGERIYDEDISPNEVSGDDSFFIKGNYVYFTYSVSARITEYYGVRFK